LQGIDVLTRAVDECKASIEGAKGRMVVKEAPRAVSEKEERALEEELQVCCVGMCTVKQQATSRE
jgi:translation initiation factor 2 subunit 1